MKEKKIEEEMGREEILNKDISGLSVFRNCDENHPKWNGTWIRAVRVFNVILCYYKLRNVDY